jgi:hypothetical protein
MHFISLCILGRPAKRDLKMKKCVNKMACGAHFLTFRAAVNLPSFAKEAVARKRVAM